MITLQVPASITDADNITVVLSEWVESEPSVRVNRVTLDIDSDCPTMLESLKSHDCEYLLMELTRRRRHHHLCWYNSWSNYSSSCCYITVDHRSCNNYNVPQAQVKL